MAICHDYGSYDVSFSGVQQCSGASWPSDLNSLGINVPWVCTFGWEWFTAVSAGWRVTVLCYGNDIFICASETTNERIAFSVESTARIAVQFNPSTLKVLYDPVAKKVLTGIKAIYDNQNVEANCGNTVAGARACGESGVRVCIGYGGSCVLKRKPT